MESNKAVCITDPQLDKVSDEGALDPGDRAVLQGVEEDGRVVVHGRDQDLQAHGPQLRGLDLARQAEEGHLDEAGDQLVDPAALALEDDDLEELGGVALRVLTRVGLQQHLLGHVEEGHHIISGRQEAVGVDGHVVVESRHHVSEVVEAVAFKDFVNNLNKKLVEVFYELRFFLLLRKQRNLKSLIFPSISVLFLSSQISSALFFFSHSHSSVSLLIRSQSLPYEALLFFCSSSF